MYQFRDVCKKNRFGGISPQRFRGGSRRCFDVVSERRRVHLGNVAVKPRGFILLEAAVTVALLAVGLTLIIQSLQASMRAAQASCDYSTAIDLAYQKLFEYDMIAQMNNTSTETTGMTAESAQEGTFDDNKDMKWKYTTHDIVEDNLTEATLTVSWKKKKREGAIDVSTYFVANHVEPSP